MNHFASQGASAQTFRVQPAVLLATFTGTLFASALMLFSVQPMFAKMALPLLGGTPAVWAVSMCFFQATLLAGYCYAHALNRYLTPERAVLAHLALLAATALALPIALPSTLSMPPEGDAYLWLLSILAIGVGLPFFAVSATAPLLQAWFARTGHAQSADPYFLYGASNAGSLIALMAYPLLIERTLGLSDQSIVWSTGFAVLAVLIAACGTLMFLARGTIAEAAPAHVSGVDAAPISNAKRATWVALATIPSGLMTAVTTYITTDIASAPFIWVVPLSLYLLTFILVFRDKLVFSYTAVQNLLPLAILPLILFPGNVYAAPLAVVAFFFAALLCHRELYLRRPSTEHLTEFYIWMSVGGVLGGIFSALIAPQIFQTVLEFNLLLLLSLLVRPGVLIGVTPGIKPARVFAAAAAFAAIFFAYKLLIDAGVISGGGISIYPLIVLTLAALFLTRRLPEHRAILVLAMIAGVTIVPGDSLTLYTERSFFGTLRVMNDKNDKHRLMLHGTTIHGAERYKDDDGNALPHGEPATYYQAELPMPVGVVIARQTTAHPNRPFSAGVVGLGTGTLACSAQPGENWRFYEIDPMVARVARNPAYFSFLSRCLPNNQIVFGDARLTLQKEPSGSLDYLVVDAFSSDAVPVHLLTREALEMYLDRLAPDGLLAIHVSNRFLRLVPSLAATVATMPGVSGVQVAAEPSLPPPDALPSNVVFLSRNSAAIDAVKRHWSAAEPLIAGDATPWTDDFSDVLSALLRHFRE